MNIAVTLLSPRKADRRSSTTARARVGIRSPSPRMTSLRNGASHGNWSRRFGPTRTAARSQTGTRTRGSTVAITMRSPAVHPAVASRPRCSSPQSGIQSLPRELSLPEGGVLRIKPLRELERLRYDEWSEANLTVQSDAPTRLKDLAGDALAVASTPRSLLVQE